MVAVSAVRQRVAEAAVESGWQEANSVFELFPGNDYREILHKGFSVGVARTDLVGDRQKLSEGTQAHTQVIVRYTYRILVQGSKPINRYDEGLDMEHQLIKGILGNYNRDQLSLTLESAMRRVELDGNYLWGEISFTAHHRLSLE